ncbi:MAG TPA: LysR substrate-binding domain-containing protein [Burkholderiales bacterium]|nr:LysR substrate-binding domain-containing protein [Burkholderiales bacterium]
MIKLDGLAAFAAVAEAGSITEAARRMGIAKSVLSERISELERSLGARLLQRSTRKVCVTEDGVAFLARARLILRETADAAAELAQRRGALTGSLRLAAPVSFGSLHLGPALFPFLQANPAIDLTLELDDRFVDIASGGYDAVIRHGPVQDNRLVVKRLASSRRVLVAAPAYLKRRGLPRSAAELQTHDAILYSYRETDWRFPGSGRRGDVVVRPQKCLRINNGIMIRDAALAGLGIALVPTFLVHAELKAGSLRTVDIGLEGQGAELFIAHPADRGPSAKIRALTDHLRKAFGDPPYWEIAPNARRKPASRPAA